MAEQSVAKEQARPMPTEDVERLLEQLMADPRLVELCGLQRTGDEVLDVISLVENQHSDILAWLLDSREGHGQGDEILRDLLVSASVQASSGESGLDGRTTTAKFFAQWPPSRIRTTSFGAAFTARELGISAGDRVDLFVIDSQNSFILVLENKAGGKQTDKQLSRYRNGFLEAVKANTKLNRFDHVFIALDREFDGTEPAGRPSAENWLHLGYSWLEVSARRALLDVDRGNAAARLVVSYCNRQTDWTSPAEERCHALAASLHQSYPQAVKELVRHPQKTVERNWFKDPESDAHTLFVLQNKSAVAILKETQGMATVKAAILEKLVEVPSESINYKRVWLCMCPSGWEDTVGEEKWPVFFSVSYADGSRSTFNMALNWFGQHAKSPADAAELRKTLTKVVPEFGLHKDSGLRRISLGEGLTLKALIQLLDQKNAELKRLVSR